MEILFAFVSIILLCLPIAVENTGGMKNYKQSLKDESIQGSTYNRIEQEIDKYLVDVKRVFGKDMKQDGIHTIGKRSSTTTKLKLMEIKGANVFKAVNELYKIPSRFVDDIVLFCVPSTSDEDCYAAALLSNGPNPELTPANELVLYKLKGSDFIASAAVPVKAGKKLATHHINGIQYLIVAECYSAVDKFDLFSVSPVFKVNTNTGSLERWQLLSDKYLSDVAVWEQKGSNAIFLAAASVMTDNLTVNTESHVYRWLGSHFDIVDTLQTFSPKCFTPFTIGSTMYLAVANFQNDRNETDIDSAIFVYNLHEEKFFLHQKLRTHAAMDIKYFSFKGESQIESFLAIANHFDKDHEGKENYETCSVIYKLLDGEYFIPFQCIKAEAATHWLPITELDGKFLLLLATRWHGVKAYQYSGWRFVETSVQYNKAMFGPGVSSMRQFQFHNRTVFTIANRKHDGYSVFSVEYEEMDSQLSDFLDGMKSWCKSTSNDVAGASTKASDLLREAQNAPRYKGSLIGRADASLAFESSSPVGIHRDDAAEKSNADLNLKIQSSEDNVSKLMKEIERPRVVVFHEAVTLEAANFECSRGCHFGELKIDLLNGENLTTFLENSYNLADRPRGSIDLLEFENVSVSMGLEADTVNGRRVDQLVTVTDGGDSFVGNVRVHGDVVLDARLTAGGTVDNVRIGNGGSVVLSEGDQFFTDSKLDVGVLSVHKLTVAKTFNDFPVGGRRRISKLSAKELELADGKISGINFQDFVNNTMKKALDREQIVMGSHVYDTLTAGVLNAKRLKITKPFVTDQMAGNSGLMTDNVIRIDTHIDNPVNPAASDAIDISISELPSGANAQYSFSGDSSNVNVYVGKRPKSRGRIKGSGKSQVDKSEDAHFAGNVSIGGKMIIENGTLIVPDVMLEQEGLSLADILTRGLMLNETTIEQNITFAASIQVEKLKVSTVNDVKPESWFETGDNGVVITAHKTFEGDINLQNGATIEGHINGIDVKDLVSNTLKKEGSQTVTGKKHIGAVTADAIESRTVNLKTIVDDGLLGKKADGTLLGGSVAVDRIKVQSLRVAGLVNGVDLDWVMKDTVFKDGSDYSVEGDTSFSGGLTVENLVCDNIDGLNFDYGNDSRTKGRSIEDGGAINLSPDQLNGRSLNVHRLHYTGSLDGVDAGEFGQWLLNEGDQEVMGQQFIGFMDAKAGITVTSDVVNNIEISSFSAETVRVDQPTVLVSPRFEGEVISEGHVNVGGLLNGGNFTPSELVLKRNDDNLEPDDDDIISFTGEKVLDSDFIAYSIASERLDRLCSLITGDNRRQSLSQRKPLQLDVEGDVHFSAEPEVHAVDGHKISSLKAKMWFLNSDKLINRTTEFTDAEFKNDITLHGLLNNFDIDSLPDKYLSLTKDQKVNGEFHFSGRMTIEEKMVAGNIKAFDLVSGLHFDEFVGGVLRNGVEQTLRGAPHFENIVIQGGLSTDGTVNGLDLMSLMRWDVEENIVAGYTLVPNLKTDRLLTDSEDRIRIQKTDIAEWESLSVRKNGEYTVRGNKTFANNFYVHEDMSVEGLVNGNKFDEETVLLMNTDQVLTGVNRFSEGSRLTIDSLINSAGMIGAVNVTDLMMRQVYKNAENVIISGQKNMSSPLCGRSVSMAGYYNKVNVTRLYEDLINPSPYMAYHYKDEFSSLKSIRNDVEKSLTGRAFLFSDWERIQIIAGEIVLAFFIELDEHPNSAKKSIAIVQRVGVYKKKYKMFIYDWDTRLERFVRRGNRIMFKRTPTSLSTVTIEEGEKSGTGMLFVAYRHGLKTDTPSVTGFLFDIKQMNGSNSDNSSVILPVADWIIKTEHVGSLLHLSRNCYLLWGRDAATCDLYCNRELVDDMSCINVTEVVKFFDGETMFIGIGRSNVQSEVEVRKLSDKELKHVMNITVDGRIDRLSMMAHPNWNQYFLAASDGYKVTMKRFDRSWESLDSSKFLIPNGGKPSPRVDVHLSVLPTDEVVVYVATACSSPTVWRWSGISTPKVFNLPVNGNRIEQVYRFSSEENYTVVVTDMEITVLKANYFLDT